jgi:hypothetical protein
MYIVVPDGYRMIGHSVKQFILQLLLTVISSHPLRTFEQTKTQSLSRLFFDARSLSPLIVLGNFVPTYPVSARAGCSPHTLVPDLGPIYTLLRVWMCYC